MFQKILTNGLTFVTICGVSFLFFRKIIEPEDLWKTYLILTGIIGALVLFGFMVSGGNSTGFLTLTMLGGRRSSRGYNAGAYMQSAYESSKDDNEELLVDPEDINIPGLVTVGLFIVMFVVGLFL